MPLSDESGTLLVDEKYVQFVVGLANSKLECNSEKIKKLEKSCVASNLWPNEDDENNQVAEVGESNLILFFAHL